MLVDFVEDVSHDLEFLLRVVLLPESVGGVNEDAVMLIGIDERDDIVGMLGFEERAFIVGVDFEDVHHLDVFQIELPWVDWVEGGLPVVHLLILLGPEPDQLEHLSANGASLQRPFTKHEHHQLVLLVIVLVLKTSAPHVAEGRISSKDYCRVVQSSEVDRLDVVQVIVDL